MLGSMVRGGSLDSLAFAVILLNQDSSWKGVGLCHLSIFLFANVVRSVSPATLSNFLIFVRIKGSDRRC